MKKILDYKTYVHYGCSFTYGQDSGGDGIHDDSLSYPAHLSNIVGNKYDNRASQACSNHRMMYEIFFDIYNNNIPDDSLIIVNLTSIARTTFVDEHPCPDLIKDVFPNDIENPYYLENNAYVFYNILSSENLTYPSEIKNRMADAWFGQAFIRHYIDVVMMIKSITMLCNQHNLPVLFTDMHLQLHKALNDWLPTLTMENNVVYEDLQFIDYGGKENVSFAGTKDAGHYHSEGYKNIANRIYNNIKDITL